MERFGDGQNAAFFEWLAKHPGGFFVNNAAPTASTRLFLHSSPCPHYPGTDGTNYTRTPKICATDRRELEHWADALGRTLEICSDCF